MKHTLSKAAFSAAQQRIPGGVNSPVRAFSSVGSEPIFVDRAAGSKLHDLDGNSYIDYVGSWGPMILGHSHPKVVEAIQQAATKGTSYGAPTAKETELAELICDAYGAIDRVRMVSSGTEATMSAIRLARGYTGRDKIIKFEGCYHGHADSLLVKAGSGATTHGTPTSPGVPDDFAKHTLTAPYNDMDAVRHLAHQNKGQIAAIIIEPIAGNMGLVTPLPGFLKKLRQLCDDQEIVLIMDEVMTGFRVAYGGAQEVLGVEGDLVCLGKIIGGGLPVGAFGGRKEIMAHLSPEGGVYQAGTLSGNPLAMSAGLTTLKLLQEEGVYAALEEKGAYLEQGMKQAATAAGITTCFQRVGSMFCTYFQSGPVASFSDAARSDLDRFTRFFQGMLAQGVHIAPSQFEAGFISTAHSRADLDTTIDAAAKAFSTL